MGTIQRGTCTSLNQLLCWFSFTTTTSLFNFLAVERMKLGNKRWVNWRDVPGNSEITRFYLNVKGTPNFLVYLTEIITTFEIMQMLFIGKNQTSWGMKIFNPLQILHAVRHSVGMYKNALVKGCSNLVIMVTTTACSRPGASFSY